MQAINKKTENRMLGKRWSLHWVLKMVCIDARFFIYDDLNKEHEAQIRQKLRNLDRLDKRRKAKVCFLYNKNMYISPMNFVGITCHGQKRKMRLVKSFPRKQVLKLMP